MSKAARDLSLTKLNQAGDKLAQKIAGRNVRLIEKYYKDVQDGASDFEKKHVAYVSSINEEIDDEPHKSIFASATAVIEKASEEYKMFQEGQEQADIRAADAAKLKEAADKVIADKNVISLKTKGDIVSIQTYIDTLLSQVQSNAADPKLMKEEMKVIQSMERVIKESFEKKLSLSKDDEQENVLKERMDFELAFNSKFLELKTFVINNCKDDDKPEIRTSSADTSNDVLRIKKIEVPTFDGKLRAYPMFKRDFHREEKP